jgi:N-acetylglucosamine-6-phosphate deacetylase
MILHGARIVTPDGVLDGCALTIEGGRIAALGPVPGDREHAGDLGGGWLLPGFIDTQVNGGGDVLFNDMPTIEGIAAIGAAHRRFGTTGFLPTLVSDTLDVIERALEAVEAAMAQGVPGVLGIHVEGPALEMERRGVHAADRIRPLDEAMLALLCRPTDGVRLVTLAPELAGEGTIERLVASGAVVAAGHSHADYEQTRVALARGVTGFTHLFNAMSPLASRAPGMVGAALEDRASWCGLIADGSHVHPAAMRAAVRARGVDGIMLVTDAMPPVGGSRASFTLCGNRVTRIGESLRDERGALAGSLLTMAQAVRNAVQWFDLPMPAASALAASNAARFIGIASERGVIAPGMAADLVHLDDTLQVTRTWIGGTESKTGEA